MAAECPAIKGTSVPTCLGTSWKKEKEWEDLDGGGEGARKSTEHSFLGVTAVALLVHH